MKTVLLSGYKATLPDSARQVLELGTCGSYGIETFAVQAGEGWAGLAICATFITPGNAQKTVQLGDDLFCPVPAAATAGRGGYGVIVFSGYGEGVCRIACDLPYKLDSHQPIDGADSPEEDPGLLAQVMQTAEALKNLITKGGTAGQVFTKRSDADGDVGWADPQAADELPFQVGGGLHFDPESRALSVDVADSAEEDNTRPITSAAVNTIVGNIEVLLSLI